jgi:S-DNA-T family DNA segregation ATPase FtsK/SpoIIIE
VVWRAREVSLFEGENLLGRSHEAVVWVDDSSVSRRHAILRVEQDRAWLQDCGSRNGTFLHGERIDGRRALARGDEFFLGEARLLYVRYLAEGSTDSGPPR